MGNREALIKGARKCLFELGYQRTTARDIVRESGVSLAAIGYHFGSKDALLMTALVEAINEWSGDLHARAMADVEAGGGVDLEQIWGDVIAAIPERSGLWSVAYELISVRNRTDEMQRTILELAQMARSGIAALHQPLLQDLSDEDAEAVAAFIQALLTGVTIYFLADPDFAPTSKQLIRALTLLCGRPASLPDDAQPEPAAAGM